MRSLMRFFSKILQLMRRNMDMVQTMRDFDANFKRFSRCRRKIFAENRRGSREHRKKRTTNVYWYPYLLYPQKKTKIIINPVVLIINQDKLIMFLRLSESQEHNFSGIMCSSEFLPCAPTDSCKHWPQEYQKERAGLLRQSLCPLWTFNL